MEHSVLEWLLRQDNPSVRYLTLTSLLDRPEDDTEARAARESVMKSGPVPGLLARQNPDGSWGDPDRFYRDKYSGTAWTLLILAEMVADPGHPGVRAACEFMLRHSRDPASGGFSMSRSARTGAGLPGGVIPCLTGNMVYSLVKLGYLRDERVQDAIAWIVKYQRADDGIPQAPLGGPYGRLEACFGRHSCHMGAAKALKALTAISPDARSSDVKRKISELAEYFLIHRLYRKSHDPDQVSRPGWLRLGFPLMYQTDILELLDLFAALCIRDGRLSDAYRALEARRTADGRWRMESSLSGKMLLTIEEKGADSRWLTLKAMRVMRSFAAS